MLDFYKCDERLTSQMLPPASTMNQHQTHDADLYEGRSFGLGSGPDR